MTLHAKSGILSFALLLALLNIAGCTPEPESAVSFSETAVSAESPDTVGHTGGSGVGAERIIVNADGTITTAESDCLSANLDGDLRLAISEGRADRVKKDTSLMLAVSEIIDCNKTQFSDARIKLLNLSSEGSAHAGSLTNISWDPTHDSAHLGSTYGENEAVLKSNAVTNVANTVKTRSYGIVGQRANARYMVFGGHPLRNWQRGHVFNAEMQQFMRNSLSWLTKRDDLTDVPFNVVIAQNDESYYFPDRSATENWLDAEYPGAVTYNSANSCNGAALSACLSGNVDLLIISQKIFTGDDINAVEAAVSQAMDGGIPVLYMHHDGGYSDLGRLLLPLFDVSYLADNYWHRLQLSGFDATPDFEILPDQVMGIKNLMSHFLKDDFSIDLSICDDKTCPVESNYQAEFYDDVNTLRGEINTLDMSKRNLFKTNGRDYHKALVVLADRFRQDVTYPMDKNTTPRQAFLKSYFADSIVHIVRDINPVQNDMGNFSRSDFSHITPATKSVLLVSKTDYMSTGFYALPGQTFKVTRTDSEPTTTHLRINLLRSGATHEFQNNGYKRPKYLSSQNIAIESGETLELTSPYGGPIFVKFNQAGQNTRFTFRNIGEHAIWRRAADDVSFAAKMAANEYDWAELITAGFQVHSKIEKMDDTIADPRWGNAAAVGRATEKYLSNFPHILAGYKGEGIDEVSEIHDFAASNGLDIQELDKVKHMNADQANCGYGCSGNPYDAYWAFNPLGHGDIHELGHGLERSRFRYSGQAGHTSTNPYAYYSKWKYYEETGDLTVLDGCQNLPFESLFNTVQASRNAADPFQFMQDAALTGWNQGAAINIQIAMGAQAEGVLSDGWHYLARLHIIDREFNIADNNDTDWLAKRDGLGFAGMSRTDARALSNNDWNLIALSHALDRDMTDYLTMWGFELSQAAKDHVASFAYTSMPMRFFVTEPDGFCTGLDKVSLPVDGAQTWPLMAERPEKGSDAHQDKGPNLFAAGHVCSKDDETESAHSYQ